MCEVGLCIVALHVMFCILLIKGNLLIFPCIILGIDLSNYEEEEVEVTFIFQHSTRIYLSWVAFFLPLSSCTS